MQVDRPAYLGRQASLAAWLIRRVSARIVRRLRVYGRSGDARANVAMAVDKARRLRCGGDRDRNSSKP